MFVINKSLNIWYIAWEHATIKELLVCNGMWTLGRDGCHLMPVFHMTSPTNWQLRGLWCGSCKYWPGTTPLCRRRRLQTPLWQLSRNAFKVCKHKNKTFCDDRLRRMNVLPQTLEIDSSIVGYCMCYMWFRIVPLHAGNVHAAVVSGARAARDILDKQASSTWPLFKKDSWHLAVLF